MIADQSPTLRDLKSAPAATDVLEALISELRELGELYSTDDVDHAYPGVGELMLRAAAALTQSDALTAWSEQDEARDAVRPHNAQSEEQPPGHTDLMVRPETLDAFMEANPLPQSDAQPVGWQCRPKPWGGTETQWSNCAQWQYEDQQKGYEYRALYTAPPSRPDAVRDALERLSTVEIYFGEKKRLPPQLYNDLKLVIAALSFSAPPAPRNGA